MHKLHNPDRRWQVLDLRSFLHVMVCSTSFSISFHIYFDENKRYKNETELSKYIWTLEETPSNGKNIVQMKYFQWIAVV